MEISNYCEPITSHSTCDVIELNILRRTEVNFWLIKNYCTAYSFRFKSDVFIMRVALVVGTRPQIIKSAPIIKEAARRGVELDVVHTGQHYDYEMSRVFFNELGLPDPAVRLEL